MSTMGEMPMAGGWTMSMLWMRMPGQTWIATATSFIAMWFAMMVAMMLPALASMLLRYRRAVVDRVGATSLGLLTAITGAAYFFVWTVFGIVAFSLGVSLAAIEAQQPALSRAVPIAVGMLVLMGGAVQFTDWKAHQLACCRMELAVGRTLTADVATAWRYGLHLGLNCCRCCAGLTATLLALGFMDLKAMAVVTVAINLERLAPATTIIARLIGALFVGAGLLLIARSIEHL